MLIKEEVAGEAPTKAASNYKNNQWNKVKKDSGSTSKEVHALNRYTEYNPIGTIYTQDLGRLLGKGKIDIPKVKPEIRVIR